MTNHRIRWAAVTALVIATMALAACSGDDSKAAATPTKGPASATATTATTPTTAAATAATAAAKASAPAAEGNVRAVIVDFILPSLTVKVGSVVEFVNQDTAAHTATSDDKTTFDSKTLNPGGGAFTFTATKAGTYPYACKIHPSMKGSITVQ